MPLGEYAVPQYGDQGGHSHWHTDGMDMGRCAFSSHGSVPQEWSVHVRGRDRGGILHPSSTGHNSL